MPSSTKRTPEEIRASIEENRVALGESLGKLREEVTELTDWRSQIRANQETLVIAAAATGFVLAGGIGGTLGLLTGRKRRKARRLQTKAQKITSEARKAEQKAAKLAAKVTR
jgi:adenine/guanine phosphoribosyltransferase-like PRPP-binding protein